MAIRYVTLNGQIHEISTESLRGLGEWGWDVSQDVISHTATLATRTTGVYNVLEYDVLPDTNGQETAINTLIQSVPDGATIVFPAGNYRINVNQVGTTGIVLKSNLTLVMEDGCTIIGQAVTNPSVGGFTLIRAYNVYNVVIIGGILDGNRKSYAGDPNGQSCMGIDFRNARDCYVYRTKARNLIGDGFAFQGTDSGGARVPGSENRNVNLIDCQAVDCARTGVFFGGAINCGVYGGEFRDTNDSRGIGLPQAGVHFENEKIANGGDEVPFTPWVAAGGSVSKNNTTGVVTVTQTAHGLTTGEYIETMFNPDDAPAYPFYSATWDRPTGEDKGKFFNHVYEITRVDADHFTYTDLYSRTALGTYTNTKTAILSQINCWRNRDITIKDVHCHHNDYGIGCVGRVPERVHIIGGFCHDNSIDGTTLRVGCSNSVISGHFSYNNGGDGIHIGNTSDLHTDSITVTNCHVYGNTGIGIYGDNLNYVKLANNNVYDNGEHGIWLRNAVSTHINGNTIRANGTLTADTYDNIFLTNADSSIISENIILTGSNTNKPRYGINVSDAASVGTRIFDNDMSTSGNVGNLNDSGVGTQQSQTNIKAGGAPAAGTWAVGDIVYSDDPAGDGFIGWVCTVAGTPGTWKTFGAVTP